MITKKLKFKFNIPNRVSLIRIALIPLFIMILLSDIPKKNIIGAIIFVFLSISDFIDGYLARKKKQVTDFGKLIDPIADKLLISTALIFLIGKGVDFWIAITIIYREVIITVLRIYLFNRRILIPSNKFGKLKTLIQTLAIIFVLLNIQYSNYFMLFTAILTVASGIQYLVLVRKLTNKMYINLPNLITLTRFCLIPFFIYYLFHSKYLIALIIFIFTILTDFFDGISARLMKQKTEVGSAIDSFTDWVLIIAAFITLTVLSKINIFWFIVLVIPSLISAMIKVIYLKNKRKVPVTMVARITVFFIYLSIILFLIQFNYKYYFLFTSIVLSYVTMVVYVVKYGRIKGLFW